MDITEVTDMQVSLMLITPVLPGKKLLFELFPEYINLQDGIRRTTNRTSVKGYHKGWHVPCKISVSSLKKKVIAIDRI